MDFRLVASEGCVLGSSAVTCNLDGEVQPIRGFRLLRYFLALQAVPT